MQSYILSIFSSAFGLEQLLREISGSLVADSVCLLFAAGQVVYSGIIIFSRKISL